MVSTGRSLIPSALGLVILLAGCTGSDSKRDLGEDFSAPDAEFDDSTGAITGQVLTSEYEPVVGAEVGVLGLDRKTTTAPDGRFTLSFVEPGEHTVVAVKLGFHQGQQNAQVVAGRATEGVDVVLERLPVLVPHSEVYDFHGFITCSIGTAGLLSEECGQGLATDVGTFGGDPRNKIDWKFNVTKVDGLKQIYLELDWVPASAAATKLGFNVAHGFKCTPGCDADLTYCEVFENFGPPVQECDLPYEKLKIEDPSKELPWDITARAWAAPVPATEVPNIVLEQPFSMYRTEFYDMTKPEGYSAVPA